MNSKFAAAALSALLYCQGLLGVAGLASVLLHDRAGSMAISHQAPMSHPAADIRL